MVTICFLIISISVNPINTLATGNQYYVDASGGADTNPGTLDKPWKTLQKAADSVSAGDTVFIRQGVYSSMSLKKSGTQNNPIIFQAYPGEHPVIDGGGWAGITDYYASSSLQYFIIDGFEIKNDEFGIFLTKSNHFIIKNNVIHGQSNTGISVDNSSYSEISQNLVYSVSGYNGIWLTHSVYNEIHHNNSYNNNENGIGISFQSNGNKIHHNVTYGNSCGADQRYGGIAIEVDSQSNQVYLNLIYDNCHSGYVTNSSMNKIFNNVFYGNTEFQALLGDWSGSVPINNEFYNNIFYITRSGDRAIGYFKDSLSYDPLQNTYDYNLYYYINGPDKSNMVQTLTRSYTFTDWKNAGKEFHGLLGDPSFISSQNRDFHLNASSPCIDKGWSSGLSVDFDLLTSPQGANYDIGAYEYPSTSLPTPSTTSTKTPTPSSSTPTPSTTPTRTPTATPLPSHTYTSTPTKTITAIPTTMTPTQTLVPSVTQQSPTPTPTTNIQSPTPLPSSTRIPTMTPTRTWTPTPSYSPTPTTSPSPTPMSTLYPTPGYEIIIDNLDSRFFVDSEQDQWQIWTEASNQHYGNSHHYNHQVGSGRDIASWSFQVPTPGQYQVYAMWWAGSWRPSDVPYIIQDKFGTTLIRVNQQTNGGIWNLLGTFTFERDGSVIINDAASSGEDIVADAIRIVYISPSTYSMNYKLFLPVMLR